MTDQSPNDSTPYWFVVLQTVACYLFWFVISGLGLVIVFLLRQNVVEDLLFLRINPWQLQAVDRFFIYGMGAIWLTAVMFGEGYLRHSVEIGKLWPRIWRILAVESAVFALSLALHYLA